MSFKKGSTEEIMNFQRSVLCMIIVKSDYNEEEQRDVKNKSHFQAVGPTNLWFRNDIIWWAFYIISFHSLDYTIIIFKNEETES